MRERWTEIPGYEEFYEVSSLGRVRSKDRVTYGRNKSTRTVRGRVLKLKQNPATGYSHVALSASGQVEYAATHRVVCRAFHGEPPTEKHEVCHGNGVKSDNRASNLRWGTRTENMLDKRLHGTNRVEKKLNMRKAREIRTLKRFGERSIDIARMYEVSVSNVDHVVRGATWCETEEMAEENE